MFTGIVEEMGRVAAAERRGGLLVARVAAQRVMEGLERGGSIAVDGCCLTAVNVDGEGFSCELTGETLARTAFAERLRPGARVNLERPMRADGRFDGHIVQGHVDGVGRLLGISKNGEADFELPSELERYVVEKGSIAVDGVSLKDKWKEGPQTFLGILVDGFPNMLMVMGPHAGLGNFPRAAEYSADWVTGLIRFARERDLTRVEATAAGSEAWTEHVIAASEGLLFTEVDSWMTGINRNVEGKQVRRIMRYSGGHPKFREHCEAVVANGYRELSLA